MKIFLIFFLSFLLVLTLTHATISKSRSLEFDYQVIVKDIPAGASLLKVWLPKVPETPYQAVETVKANPERAVQETSDKIYQNKIIFYAFEAPRM